MKIARGHAWHLAPRAAAALQRRLAACVDRNPRLDLRRVRHVLGADVSYERRTDTCFAAAVLWDLRSGCAVEETTAVQPAGFPYVPGLLSFREAPVLIAAFARLQGDPDVLLIEGHGLAHPRRFGLASHVGYLFDRPTVGCAKSRLIGRHREPGMRRGARTALTDAGEPIGRVLRTRAGVQPLYVSIGHAVTIDQACRLVLALCSRYRQPDVLRRAHQLANELRRCDMSTRGGGRSR